MCKFGYRVIEVIQPPTAANGMRGENIIRTKTYDTIKEAQERLEQLTPKENGRLIIEERFILC